MKLTIEEKKQIIHSKGASKENILDILIELQSRSENSYIDEETANLVAHEIGMPYTRVFDILTFYAMLDYKPRGKHIIEVCNNTPCIYSKSSEIIEILEEELNIKVGETTKDGMFSLNYTPCVGACDIGPVIKIGDEVKGNLNKDKIITIINTLKSEV